MTTSTGNLADSLKRYIYIVSPLIIFLWFSFAIPVGIAPYTDGVFSKSGLLIGFAESLFPALVVALLAGIPRIFSPSKAARFISALLWVIISIAVWVSLVGELFIGLGLHCRLNEAVLLLILQSDGGETGEFLSYAMSLPATWKSLALSLIPVAMAVCAWFVRRFIGKRVIVGKCAAVLAVISACVFVWAQKPVIEDNFDSKRQSYMITPFQALVSMRPLSDNSEIIHRISVANGEVAVKRDSTGAPMIVLVIGESDNKYHSSLYGYHLGTAEALSALRDSCEADSSGCLVVYEDAVTGDCTTNLVMKRLLSTNLPGHEWEDSPLLPAVLTSAGYNVGYFDNQSTPSTCEAVDYGSVFFLNAPETAGQSFVMRNDERFDYDSDFTSRYLPDALSLEEPAAVIFHLMGQHIQASKRYKPEEGKFSLDDYASLTDFSDKERTDLMHYDNATVVLADNLAKIIDSVRDRDAVVIYLSDHSEEIYDYRHQYGRTQEYMTPQRAKTLFEVPMYVYMTGEFMSNHPEQARNIIDNASSPVFTYDLPDLILDLAGVSGSTVDSARSVASGNYDSSRRRLIHHSTFDYDSLMRVNDDRP